MKATRNTLVSVAMLGLTKLVGCGSQAAEGSTSETPFALEGAIRLDGDTELRPSLAFVVGSRLEIVEGQLSGEFPSKFRLELGNAPPADALAVDPEFEALGVTGPVALGFILMLPPDHPTTIYHMDTFESGDCTELDPLALSGNFEPQTCTKTQSVCPEDGECRVRRLSCTLSPCEPIATLGDPGLVSTGPASRYMECFGVPYCYGYLELCDENACKREFSACDVTSLGDYDTADGILEWKCELLEESGNTALLNDSDLHTAASGHFVVYTTRAYSNTPLGNLERGYNLIRVPNFTPDEWVSHNSCLEDEVGMPCAGRPLPQVVDSNQVTFEIGTPPL